MKRLNGSLREMSDEDPGLGPSGSRMNHFYSRRENEFMETVMYGTGLFMIGTMGFSLYFLRSSRTKKK